MMKQNSNQSSDFEERTRRTPLFDYYFSNLNVMNQKQTVSYRKNHDLNYSHLEEEHRSRHLEQELCLQHSCPIEYICFSCCDSVLCSQCISAGEHTQHDIKNIERSRQFIKSQLQEWTIRLQSKSQLLDVFYDQISYNKAEVHTFAEGYKKKLSGQFQQLINSLNQRLEILVKSVDQFSSDYHKDCDTKLQKIRTRRLEISKMISIIKKKLDKTTVNHQAQYYSQKKKSIDQLLGEAQITFYKQQFVEPNWGIDSDTFKNIQASIDKIAVNFKYPQNFRDMFELKEGLNKSVKKSKKDLKLPDTDKFQRLSSKARFSNANTIITPFTATFTPKNGSKDKFKKSKKNICAQTLLKKRKKSSAKIVSMPASPQRQPQFSVKNSPMKSKKNLFKKKQQH